MSYSEALMSAWIMFAVLVLIEKIIGGELAKVTVTASALILLAMAIAGIVFK